MLSSTEHAVLLDVGANNGKFTEMMLEKSQTLRYTASMELLIFEPQPKYRNTLSKLANRSREMVEFYPYAAWSEFSNVSFELTKVAHSLYLTRGPLATPAVPAAP